MNDIVANSEDSFSRVEAHIVLFDLILYVPLNNISVMLGWVFLG